MEDALSGATFSGLEEWYMEDVRRTFAASPEDFRPVPWWIWTGDISKAKIDKQIRLMRDQNIHEFFIVLPLIERLKAHFD